MFKIFTRCLKDASNVNVQVECFTLLPIFLNAPQCVDKLIPILRKLRAGGSFPSKSMDAKEVSLNHLYALALNICFEMLYLLISKISQLKYMVLMLFHKLTWILVRAKWDRYFLKKDAVFNFLFCFLSTVNIYIINFKISFVGFFTISSKT